MIFLVSGIVKGTFGIGLPVAAIGLMSQFIDPRLAISMVVMPIVLSNAWQVFRAGDTAGALKRYWLFASICMIAMWFTANGNPQVATNTLVVLIGSMVILFALMNLFFKLPAIPSQFDTAAQIIAGIAAGVIGGLTAIWSPPVAAYLITAKVEKDEFVRVTGLVFFLGSLPLLAGYLNSGVMTGTIMGWSTLMIIPTIIGFTIGEVLRKRLTSNRFRQLILVLFLFLGANLIRKAFLG